MPSEVKYVFYLFSIIFFINITANILDGANILGITFYVVLFVIFFTIAYRWDK